MVRLTINSLLLLAIVAATTARSADLSPESECECDHKWSPVCGSDKKTYGNPCLLECESKKLPPGSLTVASYLSCGDFMKQAAIYQACRNSKKPTPKPDVCLCEMRIPVCGSDGKTYESPCQLECESKKLPPGSLTMVSESSCEEFNSVEPKSECFRMGYSPVCGSDLKTYDNLCLLEWESKKLPPGRLTVASYLSCEDFMKQAAIYQACRNSKKSTPKPDVCLCEMRIPVCGSDGKTYESPCQMECESKKLPPGSLILEVVYYGECEIDGLQWRQSY